jgi:hypothetical protein
MIALRNEVLPEPSLPSKSVSGEVNSWAQFSGAAPGVPNLWRLANRCASIFFNGNRRLLLFAGRADSAVNLGGSFRIASTNSSPR